MHTRSSKTPAKNTTASRTVKAVNEALKDAPERVKNQAAVALGRLGGQKGGAARAMSLSSSQRSEIAKKAALARWAKMASE